MDAVGTAARFEIDLLFPDLAETLQALETAHKVLRGFEALAVFAYAS